MIVFVNREFIRPDQRCSWCNRQDAPALAPGRIHGQRMDCRLLHNYTGIRRDQSPRSRRAEIDANEQRNARELRAARFQMVSLLAATPVTSVVRRDGKRRNVMEHPAHLRYKLNRWQRLIPHLKLWHAMGPVFVASFAMFLTAAFNRSVWFFVAALIVAWFGRGYIIGIAQVLLHPIHEMDIIIEPVGIGFLIGSERWYVHMDGVLSIRQLTKSVWTIAHHNGTVINVRTDCMPDECVAHIRAAIKDKWTYLQPFADKHRHRSFPTRQAPSGVAARTNPG